MKIWRVKMKSENKKAHAENMGVDTILQSCFPATLTELASDTFLIKIFEILEPKRLISVTGDTTIYYDDEVGKIKPTAGTIALRLIDKQGDIVGAVFYTPNSKAKPIVIDPTGYGAIVMGSTDKANEVIALDTIDDGIEVHSHLMASDKTIIVSPQKTRQYFKKMVQHWSSGS